MAILFTAIALAGCMGETPTTTSDAAATPDSDAAATPAALSPSAPAVAPEPEPEPEPAALELVSASLDRERIRLGEFASLKFKIRNTGGSDGAFAIQFLVDGEVVEERSFRVFAGASETGAFEFRPTKKGTFTLMIGASVLGEEGTSDVLSKPFKLSVIIPASLEVETVRVDRRQVPVGEDVTITAEISNSGEEAGEKDVRLYVDGEVVDVAPVVVSPGGVATVDFRYTSESRRSFGIRVEALDAGSVEFYLPPTFHLMSFVVDSLAQGIEVGDPVSGAFRLQNVGDRAGTVSWAILVGHRTAAQGAATIAAEAPGEEIAFQDPTMADWIGVREITLVLDGDVVDRREITVRGPQLGVSAGVPWNDACFDEVYTDVTVANNGFGRDTGVFVEFWVDEVLKEVNVNGVRDSRWDIGKLEDGMTRSGAVTIFDVMDECFVSDPHSLVVRVVGAYGGIVYSEVISFDP